ncbi:MAG: hypothetical protein K9W43_10905 [Candidatus Thorarchaeota archaeon]|nr:hypothetical protein [Candidatus Thorarchaeota archaeon]
MLRTDKAGGLTEFKCKICGKTVRFSIDDPSTYESKTSHTSYFGMQLTTVRVVHEAQNERHYNAIVVDHKGLFRGYRDAYVEPLTSIGSGAHQNLVVHPSQEIQQTHHKHIRILILVDRQRFWVQTYLCPDEFKPAELARLILERVEEAEKVYDTEQRYLVISLADMDMHIWVSKERVVFASVRDDRIIQALEGLATGLLEDHGAAYTNQRAINVALRALDDNPQTDPESLHRLVTDSMIFTISATPYSDRITKIVERVSAKLPIAKVLLRPLLMGQSSLIDFLEDGHWSELTEAFEMVDFINRRGLLG